MELIWEKEHYYLEAEKDVVVRYHHQIIASGQGRLDLGTYPDCHPVFEVFLNGQNLQLSKRYLPETGVTNFRDLGGYHTPYGQIAYGNFYRGAWLRKTTEAAKQYIDGLHIKNILDLRSPVETLHKEDYLPPRCTYARYSAAGMMDDPRYHDHFDIDLLVQNGHLDEIEIYLKKTYTVMGIGSEAMQYLFDKIKKHETPLYFHCSAGKDRTGVSGALIMLLLGASQEDVMHDYLLSNVYRREVNEKRISAYPERMHAALRPLYYVKPEYLQLTLDHILERYGTFENYFEKEYGIDEEMRHQIRAWYLVPEKNQTSG